MGLTELCGSFAFAFHPGEAIAAAAIDGIAQVALLVAQRVFACAQTCLVRRDHYLLSRSHGESAIEQRDLAPGYIPGQSVANRFMV